MSPLLLAADSCTRSTLNAIHHSNNHSTPFISQVRKVEFEWLEPELVWYSNLGGVRVRLPHLRDEWS